MERKKRYKIKQMMPIPEGYEVMQAIVQGDGSRMMEAAAILLIPAPQAVTQAEHRRLPAARTAIQLPARISNQKRKDPAMLQQS